MHYLIKRSLIGVYFLLSFVGVHAETLYSCNYNGTVTTYHENDAKRMHLLGANCRIMSSAEHITCSMSGVKTDYSRDEAEELLYRYPNAYCEINNQLFTNSNSSKKSLSIAHKLVIYFQVNKSNLSYKNIQKINSFATRYRNMGYTYTITGYASATGNSSNNHILSLKRAGIVRNKLLDSGINADNILSVDALGEESLRYNTKYEFSLNRAVEIKAYK